MFFFKYLIVNMNCTLTYTQYFIDENETIKWCIKCNITLLILNTISS